MCQCLALQSILHACLWLDTNSTRPKQQQAAQLTT